jgi:hypothetical protein
MNILAPQKMGNFCSDFTVLASQRGLCTMVLPTLKEKIFKPQLNVICRMLICFVKERIHAVNTKQMWYISKQITSKIMADQRIRDCVYCKLKYTILFSEKRNQ